MPPKVVEATNECLATEYTQSIMDLVDGMVECEGKCAATAVEFRRRARMHLAGAFEVDHRSIKDEALDTAIAPVVAFKIPYGRHPRCQQKSTRKWLKFE